jgi:hypothetical protein
MIITTRVVTKAVSIPGEWARFARFSVDSIAA